MTSSPPPPRPPFATAADLRIDAADAALLIVDYQERLAAVMDQSQRAACERNIGILLDLAQRLSLPVVVSEQYPKGLGPTVAALSAKLATARRFEKMAFGCTAELGFDDVLAAVARTQWIVVGMETHICVYQTVRGLVAQGLRVHVPADAVISRSTDNRTVGLDLIARTGALVTTTETVVFDALKVAGTDDFRTMSRLVR